MLGVAGPIGPLSPSGPGGPLVLSAPGAPAAPGSPAAPGAPGAPFAPARPGEPFWDQVTLVSPRAHRLPGLTIRPTAFLLTQAVIFPSVPTSEVVAANAPPPRATNSASSA